MPTVAFVEVLQLGVGSGPDPDALLHTQAPAQRDGDEPEETNDRRSEKLSSTTNLIKVSGGELTREDVNSCPMRIDNNTAEGNSELIAHYVAPDSLAEPLP